MNGEPLEPSRKLQRIKHLAPLVEHDGGASIGDCGQQPRGLTAHNSHIGLALSTALAPHFAAVQLPDLAGVLLTTAIFTAFGLLVFGLAYMIIVKASPFSIRKEIEDDQNTALAIIIGSVIIGVALIIAAAVHG